MYSTRGCEFAYKNGAMKRLIFSLAACVLIMLWLLGLASAQETDGRLDPQPLTGQVSASFDQAVADIDADKEDIQRIEERLSGFEGMAADILAARRDRQWTAMFHKTLNLAREVAAQEAAGKDVSAYRDYLTSELGELPGETYATLIRLRDRVKFPTPDLPPEKFVIADQKLFKQLREVDEIFRALISYVQIADRFGLDASVEKAYMDRELTDSAANRSIFLEIALDDVAMLRSSIA